MRTKILISMMTTLGMFSTIEAEMVREGNSVIDKETGLQWQDNALVGSTRNAWNIALKVCDELALEGHKDWRVPNQNELLSIVNYETRKPAASLLFQSWSEIDLIWDFWSSTTYKGDGTQAWSVNFSEGTTTPITKTNTAKVLTRCVRDAQ